MLFAGLITSIEMFIFKYELKTCLMVLLAVLLIFYIIGSVLKGLIIKFEDANEAKRKAEEEENAEAEGKVVEKDAAEVAKGAETARAKEDRGAKRPDLDKNAREEKAQDTGEEAG